MKALHVETTMTGPFCDMWMADEQGNPVGNKEVYDLFAKNEATGLNVKAIVPIIVPDMPTFGCITGFTDTHVILDGVTAVPKANFLDWYELD